MEVVAWRETGFSTGDVRVCLNADCRELSCAWSGVARTVGGSFALAGSERLALKMVRRVRPVGVFVVLLGKGEFILPGFKFRGCLTRFATSVSATGVEAVGVFVLVREVRFVGFVGVELRDMLLKGLRAYE